MMSSAAASIVLSSVGTLDLPRAPSRPPSLEPQAPTQTAIVPARNAETRRCPVLTTPPDSSCCQPDPKQLGHIGPRRVELTQPVPLDPAEMDKRCLESNALGAEIVLDATEPSHPRDIRARDRP